jgi:hypothetical protein
MARKVQGQNDEDEQAYSAGGVIAPVLAVRPDWKTSHKGNDDNYGENE